MCVCAGVCYERERERERERDRQTDRQTDRQSVCGAAFTPTPKSGEVELQMAPMLAAANMASIASGQFGRYPGASTASSTHTMMSALNPSYLARNSAVRVMVRQRPLATMFHTVSVADYASLCAQKWFDSDSIDMRRDPAVMQSVGANQMEQRTYRRRDLPSALPCDAWRRRRTQRRVAAART